MSLLFDVRLYAPLAVDQAVEAFTAAFAGLAEFSVSPVGSDGDVTGILVRATVSESLAAEHRAVFADEFANHVLYRSVLLARAAGRVG